MNFYYGKIFLRQLILSQQSAFQFRFDYSLRLLRAAIEVITTLMIIASFYSHSSSIVGWGKYEALLVYGIFQAISSITMFVSGYGMSMLAYDIVSGSLDDHLLKPLDSQFSICTRLIFVTNFYRVGIGLWIFGYSIYHLHLTPNIATISAFLVSLGSGWLIYFCLSFMAATLSFWTFSAEINELSRSLTSISRYPTDYFHKIGNFYILSR